MLIQLHVRNLALIEEEEIRFFPGLNILSGETGAGKSIILGALSLALGEKVDKGMVRRESEDALAEAIFQLSEKEEALLTDMGITCYDHEAVLTRKISEGRSTARINGETVPAPKLKEIGELLLDIYGQNEHQSLSKAGKHLELLDEYAKASLEKPKAELKDAYEKYREALFEIQSYDMDEGERLRTLDFLEHEIEEIDLANLKTGEDEELEEEYRRLSHGQKIMDYLGTANREISSETGAYESVSRALREVSQAAEYDESLNDLRSLLTDAESILSDASHELSAKLNDSDFSPEHFNEVESRLNQLNRLKDKHGRTIEEVLEARERKEEEANKLREYETNKAKAMADLDAKEQVLQEATRVVSDIRKEQSKLLSEKVKDVLLHLNFLDVQFAMEFSEGQEYTSNGRDVAEFYISTNPGEPMRPLKDIASGGEMSRIMLAIKTVLAESDDIDTMIFDEIDAGISGKTAAAVAEKLSDVSCNHQVICITHLPQIAAMADRHFLIEKQVDSGNTVSDIHPVDEGDRLEELSRMLAGGTITEAARENARELLRAAEIYKQK